MFPPLLSPIGLRNSVIENEMIYFEDFIDDRIIQKMVRISHRPVRRHADATSNGRSIPNDRVGLVSAKECSESIHFLRFVKINDQRAVSAMG
jgi:hypothetical protein